MRDITWPAVSSVKMKEEAIDPASDAHLSLLLKIALLNNDARLTEEETVNVIGDPTEGLW